MKVFVEKNGPVTTVILNRPERRNAIDEETAGLLREAFTAFEADATSAAAVLTGASANFCSGFDLKSLPTDGLRYDAAGEGPIGPTRMLLSKPVIAAIEGYAVAGGLELALWCDLRVASTTAVFGVLNRRWGVPLIDGGTVRLPRLIGHSRALDMILTGRAVGAEEALSFGLANRLVTQGTARAEAERLAADLARFPQLCLRADRLSTYRQWGEGLDVALRHEAVGGEQPLRQEGERGAARFASGLGRRGDFTAI